MTTKQPTPQPIAPAAVLPEPVDVEPAVNDDPVDVEQLARNIADAYAMADPEGPRPVDFIAEVIYDHLAALRRVQPQAVRGETL